MLKRFFRTSPAPAAESGFGSTVATNGPLVATGDPGFDTTIGASTFLDRGIVHVFNASTGSFIRSIEPPPSDRAASFLPFGQSVALHGDLLAVGAPQTALNGTATALGVYLYRASTGAFLRRITGPVGGFGTAVAIHGDLLLTGSPKEDSDRGAVYVHSISTGAQLARLTAADRAAGDAFGTSVALSPYYLLVGAPLDDTSRGANAGSGYLFENQPPFRQIRKLTDEGFSDLHPTNSNAQLGTRVAIRGQQLFLSAPLGDIPGGPDSGFVLEFIANQSDDLSQILPFDTSTIGFGTGLSVSDDLLAIGPAVDEIGNPAVVVFSLHNWETPRFAAALTPAGMEFQDSFGNATAVHGSSVCALVGGSSNPAQRGALFQLSPVARPPLPGLARFKPGGFAPGVPGATIASSLVQLQDPTRVESYELLTLTGPGAAGGKNRGIWKLFEPISPRFLPGQILSPTGTLASFPAFRVGGGRLIAKATRQGAGITGANNDLILVHATSAPSFSAFLEDEPLQGSGGPNPPRLGTFTAFSINHTGVASVVGTLKRQPASGVNAGNDSFFDVNDLVSPLPSAALPVREGDPANFNLGQFLPRLAAAGNSHTFAAAVLGPVTQNQAVLHYTNTGSTTLLLRKGDDPRIEDGSGEVFSAFLGESMAANGTVVVRSRLSGGTTTRASDEILHLASPAFTHVPLVRKGDIAPGFTLDSNIRIAAFLSFQCTRQGGSVLYLARLTGPGVTPANDLALFVDVTDTSIALPPGSPIRPSHLLLREGDPLPSADKATIQTIHRVAYCEDGDYMALVSLANRPGEATPANNLALLYGESRFTQPFTSDAEGFRKPFLLLRKGAHLAEYGGRPVKSLSFFPGTITPGGASGTGMGTVAGQGAPEWTLDLGGGRRASHHGGFNN